MTRPNPLQVLASLLRNAGARVTVSPERLSPSTIYDVEYRIAVVTSAFATHATRDVLQRDRVRATELKLLQFVAMRPWLLPVLREWARNASLLAAHGLRSGFTGDTAHDDVMGFLAASEVLVPGGSHVYLGRNGRMLTTAYDAIVREQLFKSERKALDMMQHVKITARMLEGR